MRDKIFKFAIQGLSINKRKNIKNGKNQNRENFLSVLSTGVSAKYLVKTAFTAT